MAQLPWFWARVILRYAFGAIYKISLVVGLIIFLFMAFHFSLFHFLALREVSSTTSKYTTAIQILAPWSTETTPKTDTWREPRNNFFFRFLSNRWQIEVLHWWQERWWPSLSHWISHVEMVPSVMYWNGGEGFAILLAVLKSTDNGNYEDWGTDHW